MARESIGFRWFALAVLALHVCIGACVNIHVNPSGSSVDDASCGSLVTPCHTINFALQKAVSGDAVLVAPGNYTGVNNTMLTVNGGVSLVGEGGANATVLDALQGARDHPIVRLNGSHSGSCHMRGFTLAHASVGSISISSGTTALVKDLVLLDSVLQVNVSAVLVEDGASAVFRRCKFQGVQHVSAKIPDATKSVAFISTSANTTLDSCKFEGISNSDILSLTSCVDCDSSGKLAVWNSTSNGGKRFLTMPEPEAEGCKGSIDINISGCTFQSHSAMNGGTFQLFSSGWFSISDSVIYSSQADWRGGALYLSAPAAGKCMRVPSMVLKNVTFRGCMAGQSGGSIYLSGAVVVDMNEVAIFSSSAGAGGAVSLDSGANVSASNNSRFQDCVASASGGGAFRVAGQSTVNIGPKAACIRNQATSGGGGFASVDTSSRINILENCVFEGNTAAADACGGTLFLSGLGAVAQVDNATIRGSGSPDAGGGGFGCALHRAVLSLDRCVLSDLASSGPSGGGAIFAQDYAQVTVTRSILTRCASHGGGGGVMRANNYAVFRISDNTVISDGQARTGGGGCILVEYYSAILMENTILARCSAVGFVGGGLGLVMPSIMNITRCNFSDCRASEGGGMRFYDPQRGTPVELSHLSFSRCEATEVNGGGLAVVGAGDILILLDHPSFVGNKADRAEGGGFHFAAEMKLRMLYGVFRENSAFVGGGMYYKGSEPLTTLGCEFESNKAGGSGGAVANFGGQWVSDDEKFLRNEAGARGGGLFLEQSMPETTFTNALFQDNVGGHSGGAMYISASSRAIFTGSSIINNKAYIGGGVCAQSESVVEFMGVNSIKNCSAQIWGGGMALLDTAQGTHSGTVLEWNTSPEGGGIYMGMFAMLNLREGTTFVHCSARKGGGLLVDHQSYLTANTATRFTQNAATDTSFGGGALYVRGTSSATIDRCIFDHNVASGSGGVLAQEGGKATLTNCTVLSNQAVLDGGSIAIEEMSEFTVIDQCQLINNSALRNGGAMHINSLFAGPSVVQKTMFEGNNATGGGAIYFTASLNSREIPKSIDQSSCVFAGNNATYGVDYGTEPTHLMFSSSLSQPVHCLSSQQVRIDLPILVKDALNQTVLSLRGPVVRANPFKVGSDLSEVIGTTVAEVRGGVASFLGLGVVADPGSRLTVQFTTTDKSVVQADVEFQVAMCKPGEKKVDRVCRSCTAGSFSNYTNALDCSFCPIGSFSASDGSCNCTLCSPGSYGPVAGGRKCLRCENNAIAVSQGSVKCANCPKDASASTDGRSCLCDRGFYANVQSSECTQCPEGANCNSPGMTLTGLSAKSGYWRASPTSTLFLQCSSCPGGDSGACLPGSAGPMCTTCDQSAGYGRDFSGGCAKCPTAAGRVGLLILVLVVVMAVVALMIRRAGNANKEDGAVIKILLSFFQVQSLVGQYTLMWPSSSRSLFSGLDVLGMMGFQVLQPQDCFLGWGYVAKLIVVLLLPCVLLILLGITTVCMRFKWRRNRNGLPDHFQDRSRLENIRVRTRLASVVGLLLYHTPMTKTLMEAFSCTEVTNHPVSRFLSTDMQIECGTATHNAVIVVAACFLVLYSAGIPIALMLRIRGQYSKLFSDESVKKTYGFIYMGYQPRWWWWEAVAVLRRVVIAIVSVLLSQYWYVGLLLLQICLVLHLVVQPFASRRDNELETVSLAVSWVTLLLGTVTGQYVTDNLVVSALGIIIILCNTFFFAAFVAAFAGKNWPRISGAMRWVGRLCPCCQAQKTEKDMELPQRAPTGI